MPWLSPLAVEYSVAGSEDRIAGKRLLRLCGVHLASQPFVLFELWRWWEIKTILHRLNSYMAESCLLVGDFNAIAPGDTANVAAWPNRLKQMLTWQGGRIFHWALAEVSLAGFVDCYRQWHPVDAGFTLPTPAPNSRLDYIFVAGSFISQLQQCFVLREPLAIEMASDHYPVVAEFDF
jgi:exonuclease III